MNTIANTVTNPEDKPLKEKLTEAKFYASSNLLGLIDTAAASRFQRRADFIRQCVVKELEAMNLTNR